MNGVAVIDERKAIRLCGERFPLVGVRNTVDILAGLEVERALGRPRLADAVFNALQVARMRVLPKHLERVIDLVEAS